MKPSESEEEVVEEQVDDSSSAFKLSINSVNIDRAQISYTDNQSNMTFST
jgi:hypothetical protein